MKRIVFILVVILASASIVNSIKSIYSLWKKQDVLVTTRKELEKDKSKNQELKKELQAVSSQQFVEQEARNKLFMARPGENTVFIPSGLISSESVRLQTTKPLPNWALWWHLFF